MFSVRVTTPGHGSTNAHVLVINVVVTSLLIARYGIDYLTIFCASALLHLMLETGLAVTGIRKGVVYVYGRRLPRAADALLRATVEGPGFCVPAFFVADRVLAGDLVLGLLGPFLLAGAVSLYMGLADRRGVRTLGPGEEPILSRRAMTRPGAVMLLSLINTVCLTVLLTMPDPFRAHALIYLGAYIGMVMLFYLINYNLGVRRVELYDAARDTYTTPGPLFQAAGLTYDSAYEMALLISPAYWVTFYLGLFQYGTLP